ncbi:MAG: helix-turn-helix domain-containing protein [Myxococcota bacterium]|nr:helix-turn-helix domain-containing protein [Myxococcota bacterium]
MARSKTTGPAALRGSKPAKQALVAILEALSGTVGTGEAAERLGISLSRYYQLETRALQGMLASLEPRPRGRRKTAQGEISALQAEKKELEKELRRHRSLLRAAQRSVGLVGTRRGKKASSKRRRQASRGATVRKTLCEQMEAPEGGRDGTAKQPAPAPGSRGREPGGA